MSYNIATRSKFPKTLFKDTISTLSTLHSLGKKLGLITATTRSSLEYDLKTYGVQVNELKLVVNPIFFYAIESEPLYTQKNTSTNS
ncbi:hypothetical protein RHABOEDO_001123 [Candidatus Rhabdochlamydia oedothoracis]|uniref:Uncharacterized protein n=2 Tax=Candidatus Rhabdochlamydiaceae TaxID=689704 RepID=A0ABX8V203_9BACT|nr:hypothetical protein RHOW815_001066 [Candidatus Rhabdochlamydia sp. W815]QYF48886.1 hypothetical protein RHABOEDO_001123 [Candidatus Rhabdochlamydia oedothoracis]